MKLVLVSDLHGVIKTLEYLNKIIAREKPAGVIISGDITMREDISFLDKLFGILESNKIEGYLICGNADVGEALRTIDESKYSINQRCRSDLKICGLCDHEEALMNPEEISGSIFVTHRPPLYSILEQKFKGAPKYHISGHIHSRKTVKKFPSTTLIQVPTLQSGSYAVLDTQTESVNFLTI